MRKILFTILLCVCMFSLQSNSKRMEHKVPEFMTAKNPTPELVYQCARYYGLQHVHVVVAQSILETGHYKSDGCTKHNNLFGLYDSRNKRYYRFDTWQSSVKAYKNKVQYKYQKGDYYAFLKRIGYAEDPNYIAKVKSIEKRYGKRIQTSKISN